MKIILTGATGMAGEGVLFECLENINVTDILIVGRKPYGLAHPKLKELIVPDFLKIETFAGQLSGYDACFYCAGISSVGMTEEKYLEITHTTTLSFAKTLLAQNPGMVFNYITGRSTDSSENGSVMWARIKGKTENDLMELGFKGQYNFRPALMIPSQGQKSVKPILKIMANVLKYFMPNATISLKELGKAMVNVVLKGYPNQILEVKDIKIAAK
jgi:uncharacterized protein YbjT (DUF2867 family)